jgi:hypothetical protein
VKIVGCMSVSVETSDEFSLARNVLTEPLPRNGLFHVYSLQWERVFGESLASKSLPLWFQYSGFQASCYSTKNVTSELNHNRFHNFILRLSFLITIESTARKVLETGLNSSLSHVSLFKIAFSGVHT